MSAILGFVQRKNSLIGPEQVQKMRQAMAHWGPDGSSLWVGDQAGLGQLRLFSTAEANREQLPQYDRVRGIAFTAAARIDNRQELIAHLRVPDNMTDGDLLFAAYCHWGKESPNHIFGDWSFAAWHPKERRLFLARDHFGNSALYYYIDQNVFAFASDRTALLALDLAPWEMDELFLGQVLISWSDYHGQRTIYTRIKRLPPAHTITITPTDHKVRQYWHLEDTKQVILPKREDYVVAFKEQFDRAVQARLNSPDGKVAVTLSGGLDSGSVTAVAAEILAGQGQRLDAFTSVPTADPRVYVGRRFGDELPFAQATADFAGNVDLHPISGTNISPIGAIQRGLDAAGEPYHAAGNQYWMWDLKQTVHDRGHTVLLTGQMGNAGISWVGDYRSQPISFQLQGLGWRKWLREALKQRIPEGLYKAHRRRHLPLNRELPNTAIHPEFAQRLHIWERYLAENQKPPSSPLEKRLRIIKPGCSIVGFLHAQAGAAHGLDVRDPTADARLLAFSLSVPDHIFRDPQSGLDRWLIREAMKGRLPDEVRLNRRRGRQAGDLVPRLRDTAPEVEETLSKIASSPAAAYVDVPYMRRIWQMVQAEDSKDALNYSVTVLTKGIMAGLFVINFFNYD